MMHRVRGDRGKGKPREGFRALSSVPSISIVIPCLNQAPFIESCVRSLLEQAYPRLQILVMDGGSTDGTLERLRKFGNALHVHSRPDGGQAEAIHRGLRRASGELANWLNGDDLLIPGALNAMVACLKEHPESAMVYGEADYVDRHGRRLHACGNVEPWKSRILLETGDIIVQPAALFRREAYEQVGGVDARLNWSMDYDLWLKFASRWPLCHLPRVLAHYRWSGGNKSASGGRQRLEEVSRVAARHGGTRLPGQLELEWTRQCATEALEAFSRRSWGAGFASLSETLSHSLGSPRALRQLTRIRTWRMLFAARDLRRAGSVNGLRYGKLVPGQEIPRAAPSPGRTGAGKGPLVSVIMPVYNAQAFLDEAIESILAQTYRRIEFIIIDDASRDGSSALIQKYARRDRRIRPVRNSVNRGIVKTRNIGFGRADAAAQYFAIMDADDVSHPDRLRKQVDFLEAHRDHALVGSQTTIIDEHGRRIGRRTYPTSWEAIRRAIGRFDPIAQPACLIRASALREENRFYDEDFEGTEDYELWLRLGVRHRIANLDEDLLAYRISREQSKSRQLKKTLRDTLRIQRRWLWHPQYRSLFNLLFWVASHGLLILPNGLILWLFMKIRYRP